MIRQYNQNDITKVFGRNAGLRYQNILAGGQIRVTAGADEIRGVVEYKGNSFDIAYSPAYVDRKVSFENHNCSCGDQYCQHIAAAAFHALASYPALVRTVKLPPSKRLLGSKGKKNLMPGEAGKPGQTTIPPIVEPDKAKSSDNKQDKCLIVQLFSKIYYRLVKIFKQA